MKKQNTGSRIPQNGTRPLLQRCRRQAVNLVDGAEFLSTAANEARDIAWLRGYVFGVRRMMSAVAEESRRRISS